MKTVLILLATAFSSLAVAHIEPGVYKGSNPRGGECSITAVRQYFENDFAHPLSERIVVSIGEDTFTVGHPPVVDASQSLAFFNHDVFQGVLPTKTGAKALIIEMNHTEGSEGPTKYSFIENKWRSGEKNMTECQGLKLNR